MKNKILISLAALMAVAVALSGCGQKKTETDTSGKTVISVGDWPNENLQVQRDLYEGYLEEMNEKYPDIEVVPDEWAYDLQTFLPKASSGQLPTMYNCHLTETKKIINAGYSADITEVLNEYGYVDYLNKNIMSLCEKDGKYYGIPYGYYIQGLICNVEVFKEAGLVDENGVPLFPQTWEEVAEISAQIKEKTGKAGLVLPTINNCGGWHFMNIAWSYGVEFMKQDGDKWVATFDTQECADALQFVKDLKWKYNALPDNALIDQPEMQKQFATGQAAMYIASGPEFALTDTYGLLPEAFSMTKMPAGPKGRFAQMGGKTHMFSPDATKEQIEACFKWVEIAEAFVPPVTEEQQNDYIEATREILIKNREQGWIVAGRRAGLWDIPEVTEKLVQLGKEESNIPEAMYQSYYDDGDVTVKAEEPMNCQDLYAILDACIQEVLTNKDADPAELLKQANADFQKNYLDKI